MAKKRGQNEGTISKRDDGTWWGRITVGRNDNGTQKRKAFYGKTRQEVQKKITAVLSDLDKGIYRTVENHSIGMERYMASDL